MRAGPESESNLSDSAAIRLRRLRMRAWRRGIREMDLILGPFADTALSRLSGADLDLFESLLEENDHDLYKWISARLAVLHRAEQAVPPASDANGKLPIDPGADPRAALIDLIAAHAGNRAQGVPRP